MSVFYRFLHREFYHFGRIFRFFETGLWYGFLLACDRLSMCFIWHAQRACPRLSPFGLALHIKEVFYKYVLQCNAC